MNLKVQKREWNGSLTDQIVNLLLNFARMQSKIDICHGKSKTPLACSNIIKQKSDQSFNLFGYFLIFIAVVNRKQNNFKLKPKYFLSTLDIKVILRWLFFDFHGWYYRGSKIFFTNTIQIFSVQFESQCHFKLVFS